MNELRKLPEIIHKCMTIGELPTSYKVSLTYEEQLMWFCRFLEEQVIPVVNNNSQVVQELKTYVEEYFDNLDVQDEINNKLEAMAESGELEELIAQYVNLSSVLAYDTLSDLLSATNIVDGSFARTYGEVTYNDGKGAFYKIREITNQDVVDNETIFPISTNEELIAEKMPDYEINSIKTILNDIDPHVQTELVTIGDSWTMNNYPYITDQNNMWNKIVAKRLNLNLHNYAVSGAGFTITDKTILSQVQSAVADTNLDKDKVKYLIYLGGINDLNLGTWSTLTDLQTAIETCFEAIKTNFTKSNIIIIGSNCYHHLINGTNHTTTPIIEIRNTLLNAAQKYSFTFIDSIPFMLGQPDLIGTGEVGAGHPTELGQKVLASKILSAMNGMALSPIKTGLTPFIYNPTNPTYNASITRILINGSPKAQNLMSCEISIAVNGTTVPSAVQSYNFKELAPSQPNRIILCQGTIKVATASIVGDGTINVLFDSTTLPNTNTIQGYFEMEV